jgi:FixJ family two-component response regulator
MGIKGPVAVVDDDPSTLRSIERLLGAYGYAARVYGSAESFLDDACPAAACLVLDIDLGGKSGIELRQELTASGRDTPVIFITGTDDDGVFARAVDAGCVAFLRKPFAAHLLVDAIRKAESVPFSRL